MNQFNIRNASSSPATDGLRADPRHPKYQGPPTSKVGATGDGLIRSTLKAGVGALVILTVFVLPSEYGIDPTRVGSLLGLTEMGQIKQQLFAEAEAEDAAIAAAARATADPQIAARLDAIEAQLSDIAEVVIGIPPASVPKQRVADTVTVIPPDPEPAPAVAEQPVWRDNFTRILAPGEGIEVKMAMREGDTARFEWSANGAVLNHDTHGDGGGQSVTYVQGRGVPGEKDELTAAFTGNHGWFWRNRTRSPVTLTLRVGGAYERFIAP